MQPRLWRRIVVGSLSGIKFDAVKEAAAVLTQFGGAPPVVVGADTPSLVRGQPQGHKETEDGARNRAVAALQLHPDADVAIGIENGTFLKGTNPGDENDGFDADPLTAGDDGDWEDAAAVVFLQPDGATVTAWSDRITIPPLAVRGFKGETNWTDCKDPHAKLTNGARPRVAFLSSAVRRSLLELLGQPTGTGLGDAKYWQDRWTHGQTGWRTHELAERPYARNTALALAWSRGGSADAEQLAALRGATVFVPLCGDTTALDFFVGLGCHVVGADVARLPLAAAAQRIGAMPAETGDEVCVHRDEASGGSLRLHACDIFAFTSITAPALVAAGAMKPFDIVYDRASLVVFQPLELRRQYVDSILRLCNASPATRHNALFGAHPQNVDGTALYVLNAFERPVGQHHKGPPFHVDETEDLPTLFEATQVVPRSGARRFFYRGEIDVANPDAFVDAVHGMILTGA